MSPKTRAVFFKELRDCLRDRRTLLAMVVVPTLLYPIMILGMGELMKISNAKLRRETCEVAVPRGTQKLFERINAISTEEEKRSVEERKAKTAELLKQIPGMAGQALKNVAEVPQPPMIFVEMDPEDAAAALIASKVRASIAIPADFEELVQNQQAAHIGVKYDQAEHRSRDASARIKVIFENYQTFVIAERLKAKSLKTEFLQPFKFTTENVAQATKVGGSMLGAFLPILFIMMIIAGAISPAIDMTAGEKERSTLETLIGSPVRPIEIITGKFLAIATMSMGNAALNVASCAVTFSLMPTAGSTGFQFPWSALPLTLLLLIPLALFFSGLLLAVCSFAANQKEAQVYVLPIYLIPVLGILVVLMPGIELEGPLLFAPVINTALLIKDLFVYKGTNQQFVYVFMSTLLYAAGTVALAARIFAREEILFNVQGSLRLFLSRRFFKPVALPSASDALLVSALLFPVYFYFQLWLSKVLVDMDKGVSTSQFAILIIVSQYLLFLALPIGVAWYLKCNLKKTFLWNAPPLSGLVGAAFMGLSSWLVVNQLVSWQSYFWEYSPGDMAILEKAIAPLFGSAPGIALLIFLMGITPGICEEHLFRGFIQQGMSRSGKWTTLLTVGAVFAAYHADLFKQPILMAMGVTLAYTAWKTRSIWPGVLFHLMHNSISLLAETPQLKTLLGIPEAHFVAGQPLPGAPTHLLIPGVLLFMTGLYLIKRSRISTDSSEATPKEPSENAISKPLLSRSPA